MDTIVLNVLSQQAGAILGQGGSRVSAIRQDTGSDVRIQQSGTGVTLRRVEIRGDNATNALLQVLAAIEENASEDVSLQLLISSHYAGSVIGPQGQTIQGLRQAHPNVQLHMEKNVGHAPERVIHVTGVAKDVGKSILDIIQIIDGGLKDGTLAANTPSLKRPRSRSNVTDTHHKNPSVTTVGRQQQVGHGPAVSRGRTEGQMTLTITNEQAGKIIGKGGRQIHSIRQQCGCKIDLEPGNERRTLRVSGPLSHIEEACRVLSAHLDEH